MIKNTNNEPYHKKISLDQQMQIEEQNNYNYIEKINKEAQVLSKNNHLILSYPINTLEDFMTKLVFMKYNYITTGNKYQVHSARFSQGVEFKQHKNNSVCLLDQLSQKNHEFTYPELSKCVSKLNISTDQTQEIDENTRLLDEFIENINNLQMNVDLYYEYMLIRIQIIIYTLSMNISNKKHIEVLIKQLNNVKFAITDNQEIYPYSQECINKINGIIILLSNFIYQPSLCKLKSGSSPNFYKRLDILKHNINNMIVNGPEYHNHKVYLINEYNKTIYLEPLVLIDEYVHMELLYK